MTAPEKKRKPPARPERPWWRRPFQYFLRVRPRPRHVHGTLVHRLLGERLLAPALWVPDRDAVARGMAIGVFVGFLPVPGLQVFFAALLCYILRSNVMLAVLATFITNPLTAPPILWAQYKFGQWLLHVLPVVHRAEYGEAVTGYFSSYGMPLLVGSLASSVLLALAAYPLTLGAWNIGAAAVARHRLRREERLRAARRESRQGARVSD